MRFIQSWSAAFPGTFTLTWASTPTRHRQTLAIWAPFAGTRPSLPSIEALKEARIPDCESMPTAHLEVIQPVKTGFPRATAPCLPISGIHQHRSFHSPQSTKNGDESVDLLWLTEPRTASSGASIGCATLSATMSSDVQPRSLRLRA